MAGPAGGEDGRRGSGAASAIHEHRRGPLPPAHDRGLRTDEGAARAFRPSVNGVDFYATTRSPIVVPAAHSGRRGLLFWYMPVPLCKTTDRSTRAQLLSRTDPVGSKPA